MLVTPTLKASSDPMLSVVRNFSGESGTPTIVRPGVIQISHWNPKYEISGVRIKDEYPEIDGYEISPYGVADNVDQVLALHDFEGDPRKYFISIVEIRKDQQPDYGGWRWHKWGEYIGTREPQREYLYDEPEIDSVITYHIYEVE